MDARYWNQAKAHFVSMISGLPIHEHRDPKWLKIGKETGLIIGKLPIEGGS